MRRRPLLAFVVALLTAAWLVSLRGQGLTPGTIRGRVLAAETNLPIRAAQVRLTGGGLSPRLVVTDYDGRYQFGDLPRGEYTLSASKAGMMSLSYGQHHPRDVIKPVEVAEGEILNDVNMRLPRGAVIVARVSDESGEPLAGVSLQLTQYRVVGGERHLVPAQGAGQLTTDDLGQSRLYGLAPGEYYLYAAGNSAQLLTIGASNGARAYTPTFFPGTPYELEAQPIVVTTGQETSATFSLVNSTVAKVSGNVRTSEGLPAANARVNIARDITPNRNTQTSQGDGAFALTNVPPGDYTISVIVGTGVYQEAGSVTVRVTGTDISGLLVNTVRIGTIRGRLIFDGTPPTGTVKLMAVPTVASARHMPVPNGDKWNADRTFEMTGLLGPHVLRVSPAIMGWTVKEVRLNGRDVTDTPLDVSSVNSINDLQVILTDKRTEVTGTVVDSRGNPVTDYVAVVFTEDRAQWTPHSRSIGSVSSDRDGKFVLKGLPPGRYYATAVPWLEAGDDENPALFPKLVDGATRVTLAEGETRAVTLRIEN